MGWVTLRVGPLDVAGTGFPIELIEDDGRVTRGELPLASLVTDDWAIPVEEPPPGRSAPDVATAVADANSTSRDLIDWASLGTFLFDCLLPLGSVRDRWRLLPPASHLILDIAPDPLARVPWELASSAAPLRRPVLNNALSRMTAATAPPPASPSAAWPFRLLLLVGCAAGDEAALGVDEEVRTIDRKFLPFGRSVDVQVLRRPTKPAFRTVVDSFAPHVLHFVGHGEREPGGTAIGLKVEADSPWLWTPDDVQLDLPNWGWTPGFVFLNACRSAVENGGTWGFQRSFIEAGSAAVVAMLADVRGDRAGLLAAELYGHCARGETIQSALREARIRLRDEPGVHVVDYSVPSLLATGPEIRLFTPLNPPADLEYERCREFEDARYFANCRAERRFLTHLLAPPRLDARGQPNVLVLRGARKVGKTHLLKWCMETWALLGARVRYVELGDGTVKNFLAILRQIRDGDPGATLETRFLHGGLPEAAFHRFNWELNNLLETGQAGEWPGAGPPVADRMLPVSARGEARLEPQVCASFLEALKLAAARQPLVLVFDRLGKPGERFLEQSGDFAQLMTHLFRPIADLQGSRVRLVFSVSTEEYDDFGLSWLPAARTAFCDLPHNYTTEELSEMTVEMLPGADARFASQLRELVRRMLDFSVEAPNGPKGLAKLENVLKFMRDANRLPVVERMR
jgi:hypothetical protein